MVRGLLRQGLAVAGGLVIAAIASQFPEGAIVSPALADALANWNFNPTTHHLEVTVKAGTKPRYFLMAQPARIVLDLPDTSIGDVKTQAAYSGPIRQIRVSQFQPGITRIVMELSPNVTLAPGQVQLENAGTTAGNDRWVLRPLIAQASAPASASKPAAQAAPAKEPTPPAPIAPRSAPAQAAPPAKEPAPPTADITPSTPPVIDKKSAPVDQKPTAALPSPRPADDTPLPATGSETPAKPAEVKVTVPPPVAADNRTSSETAAAIAPPADSSDTAAPGKARDLLPPGASSAAVSPAPSPRASTAASLDILPALAPGATTAPSVTVPPLDAKQPPLQSNRSTPPQSDRPSPAASTSEAIPSQDQRGQTPEADIPTALPTVSVPNQTVKIPPLNSSAPAAPVDASTPLPPSAAAMPSSTATAPPIQPEAASSTPSVSVPALQSDAGASAATSAALQSETVRQPNAAPVIEFGQPLPQATAIRRSSQGRLPAGTLLSLRYPGTKSLSLKADNPQQEVLMLQTDVRDESGNVLLLEGSQVIGRFETNSAGSRFVAQAISIGGRNVPLEAESSSLTGGRDVSDRKLVRNSGIGALAGGILGSFSGLGILGGAATGAAITVVTSPKPATIEPGQIFQVRLLQDLPLR